MRVIFKVQPWLLSGCLVSVGIAASAAQADNANPYSTIIDRNVFRLVPPPPPPKPEEKPVELPKVMLSGFWTVGDSVKVLLAIPGKDAKTPPTYLTLANGEGNNDLEVLDIRAGKGEVDIRNAGTPQTLTLASNSFASTATATHSTPPPMPFRRGFPGSPRPAPAPATTSAAASTGGSAIVIGGNNYNSANSDSSSGSSAFVGGGANYGSGQATSTATLASSLLSPAQQYHMPEMTTAPASLPQQIVLLQAQDPKNGGSGPPAPPIPGGDEDEGGGPPAPP